MNTLLCKEGYLIKKNSINKTILDDIEKELTVEAVQTCNFNTKPKKFKVYQDNDEFICIPKYYGINKYGMPSINKEPIGTPIDIKFNSELRNTQKEIINIVIPHLENKGGGVLCLPCGYGKCLAYDTGILMFDGTIKKVQNINKNDLLMGDDSTYRTVLSLARGNESMYNIFDEYNSKYTVNESHILSLFDTLTENIIDISVKDYLAMKNNNLKGYRVPVFFNEQQIEIHPYNFGYNELDSLDCIPNNYKINSKLNRLLLLFGICDKIGFLNYTHNSYEIEYNNHSLLDDIVFLAKSVGYTAYYEYVNKIIVKPVVLMHNKYNLYNIRVENIGIGNYYGFEIDGNRRFILDDFTVTHNTILSLYIISQLKVKTLVIVHKSFLLNQWKDRAEEFTSAKVGIIQRNKIYIDDKDIVIGMLQSIAKDRYTPDVFKDFGLVIFDEAHHAPSEYFSKALPIINCRKTIALSATPKRSDKLEKVLYWYFGNIMYKLDNVCNNSVLVYNYNYKIEHEKFKEFKLRTGDLNRAKTINQITTIGRRNKFIINVMREMINDNRKIIVLSDRVEHLKLLKDRLDRKMLNITTSFYIGKMKIDKLIIAEKAQVIFATYSMAAEALDIPELNTLFMVTPRREIEQAVGRILRKINPNIRPLIYDFVDQLPSFIGQNNYRRRFYNKMKFEQETINIENNEIITRQINSINNSEIIYDFID